MTTQLDWRPDGGIVASVLEDRLPSPQLAFVWQYDVPERPGEGVAADALPDLRLLHSCFDGQDVRGKSGAVDC